MVTTNRFLTTLLLVVLSLPAVVAATPKDGPLTVSEAVQTALWNSPALRSAGLQAQAGAAVAKQAKGHRLPRIDLTELYHGSNVPAEVFANQLNQRRFDKDEFFLADPNNPDWLNTWVTRLEVVQPVYTGGELSSRVEQAEMMAQASDQNHARMREQVAFDTLSAFTDLSKAREFLGLMRTAEATTAEHVELAERYADNGMIVPSEVLKARVHLAQVEEQVQQAESGVELARAALNFHMGIDQSLEFELAAPPAEPPVDEELDALLTAALAERHDLTSARRQRDAGALEVKTARSGYKPELAIVGRYDLYDDVIFGSNGHSGAVMFNATINLFRGGSDKQAIAAANYRTQAYDSDIERFEEGIRLDVRQAWQGLSTARTRRETAASALESAREALRVIERRFEQGLDKMIDLLDAETALRETETRELVARYDVAFATYRLHFAAGTSLLDPLGLTEEVR